MLKLYVQDNCTQCKFTEKRLDSLGVEYKVINLDHDQEDPDFLTRDTIKDMGFMSTPVAIPDDATLAWSGFQPSVISKLQKNGKI